MESVNWLYKLRPVNYIYKSDNAKWKQYGLIAEEVDTVNKWVVSYDYVIAGTTTETIQNGTAGDTLETKVATVNYSRLIVPAIKALQDHNESIKALEKSVNYLTNISTITTEVITDDDTLTISNSSGIPKVALAATIYFDSPSAVNFNLGVKQINNGKYDGQIVSITGTNNTNTLTIHQGDNVKLNGGVNWIGGKGDELVLKWSERLGSWYERSRSNN